MEWNRRDADDCGWFTWHVTRRKFSRMFSNVDSVKNVIVLKGPSKALARFDSHQSLLLACHAPEKQWKGMDERRFDVMGWDTMGCDTIGWHRIGRDGI